MLFKTLKRLVKAEQTKGLSTKIDIFFAAARLTEQEYEELSNMLKEV